MDFKWSQHPALLESPWLVRGASRLIALSMSQKRCRRDPHSLSISEAHGCDLRASRRLAFWVPWWPCGSPSALGGPPAQFLFHGCTMPLASIPLVTVVHPYFDEARVSYMVRYPPHTEVLLRECATLAASRRPSASKSYASTRVPCTLFLLYKLF